MRLATTLALSAALATAACSNGPDAEQKEAAQAEMKDCMGIGAANGGVVKRLASPLTDVTVQLDGLDAENITLQQKPDFTIRGSLPAYEEKSKDGDKTVKSEFNVDLTLKSVSGEFSAAIAGSKLTTNADGKTRNFPLFTQNLEAGTKDFKGVDVSSLLSEGQRCAINAQNKLGLGG